MPGLQQDVDEKRWMEEERRWQKERSKWGMVSVFTKGDGLLLSFCQKRDVTWWESDRRLLKAGRLTREEPESML